MKNLASTTKLNNGIDMPWFGLGVYKAEDGEEVERAVLTAIEAGYRSIDTAAFYHNEAGVGRAIKASGVPREELFVTTKVWNDQQGYESTLKAFEESRQKLGLDYVDLYLIHWPGKDKFKDTWRALEKLYQDGLVKAIGVSNFHIHHLKELMETSDIKPVINQVELHPRLNQKELRAFCKEENIQIEAWSPLMRGQLFDHPTIQELSDKYKKSPAQIILRWDLQHGIVTIPKSVTPKRIKENGDVFDFELTSEDIEAIDRLDEGQRIGPDPDEFIF